MFIHRLSTCLQGGKPMHNRFRFALPILLLLTSLPALAQTESTLKGKNLIGGEVLGRGIFLTVNYERYLTNMLSAGVGAFGVGSEDGAVFVLPFYGGLTFGYPHSLYLSGGVTVFGGSDFEAPGEDTATASTPVFQIGYQYMAGSGFYIRPAMNYLSEVGLAWPGIAVGGAF
jgi:hypothetical protein